MKGNIGNGNLQAVGEGYADLRIAVDQGALIDAHTAAGSEGHIDKGIQGELGKTDGTSVGRGAQVRGGADHGEAHDLYRVRQGDAVAKGTRRQSEAHLPQGEGALQTVTTGLTAAGTTGIAHQLHRRDRHAADALSRQRRDRCRGQLNGSP